MSKMKIQISHYEFDISAPFAEGHVLTAAEAKALNVERGERLRTQISRYLAKLSAKSPSESILSGEALAALRARATDLDANFEFGMLYRTKPKVGTIDSEILLLAEELAKEQMRQAGRDPDDEAEGETLRHLVEANKHREDLFEEARKRLEVRASVAQRAMDELLAGDLRI
jgi:hypothetical protein